MYTACGDGSFCLPQGQSFVPGRTPSPRDVLIDSIGIFAGIEITRLLCYIGRKTIFRPLSLGNSRTKEEYEEDYC